MIRIILHETENGFTLDILDTHNRPIEGTSAHATYGDAVLGINQALERWHLARPAVEPKP